MRIKVDSVRFHRNGVMGEGFYCVAFRWRMQGERKERRLMATVFDVPGRLAVISPDNARNCWRGDNFEIALRAAIAEADRDGSAYDQEGADNL